MKILQLTGLIIGVIFLTCYASANEQPNILFLFADDQRADAIGAYGNKYIKTPHIDSLVNEGYSFRNAYCMGSMHGAVCQPSRAMLMSGRSLYKIPMDLSDTLTMPEYFRLHGYSTFGTGKWHNGEKSFLRSFEKGAAVMIGGMSNHEAVPIQDVSDDGKFTNKRTGDKFSSTLFADATIDFLEQQSEEKPFFAYVSFTSPHDPRQPPPEFRQPYYDALPPLPENFKPQHPFDNGWLIGRDENLAAWPRTESVVRDQLAEYYGMITHMDNEIGRILKTLEEKGLRKNTIIIYAADHGLAVGSHGLLGKQNLYEHSMKAPLIFCGNNISKGKESDKLVYLMDIFPTLCSLSGLDIPEKEDLEGIDINPSTQGNKSNSREFIFLTYKDSQRSIRNEKWKLIRYPKINHTQLFDLENDPFELRNLAEEEQYQKQTEILMVTLKEYQKKYRGVISLTSRKPAPKHKDLSGIPRKADRSQPKWIVDKYFSN